MDSHLKDWIQTALEEGYKFYTDTGALLVDIDSILKVLDRPEGIMVQPPRKRLKIELPRLLAERSDYIG